MSRPAGVASGGSDLQNSEQGWVFTRQRRQEERSTSFVIPSLMRGGDGLAWAYTHTLAAVKRVVRWRAITGVAHPNGSSLVETTRS